MRDLHLLDQYRDESPAMIKHFGWGGDGTCGTFLVPSPMDSAAMRVVASSGEGWDHVSVSRKNRCPNYHEMKWVYRLFFKDDEHVNYHPFCLHLWRPHETEIPCHRQAWSVQKPPPRKQRSRAMIPSPLKAANLKIATMTILLQEARNAFKAMFLLLMESDKADEAYKKFGHLGKEINKYAPDKAAFPAKERRA